MNATKQINATLVKLHKKKKIELKIESFEFEMNLFVDANKICKAIRVKLQRKK